MYDYPIRSDELYHHGIKGMRWGIRRYQNADGTLTAEGVRRYGNVRRLNAYNSLRSIGTAAGVGLASYAAYKAGLRPHHIAKAASTIAKTVTKPKNIRGASRVVTTTTTSKPKKVKDINQKVKAIAAGIDNEAAKQKKIKDINPKVKAIAAGIEPVKTKTSSGITLKTTTSREKSIDYTNKLLENSKNLSITAVNNQRIANNVNVEDYTAELLKKMSSR